MKTEKDHWKQDSSTKKDKVAHAGKKVACWSLGMGYPKNDEQSSLQMQGVS